jgi:SSS family solute:Na+ symporter
MTLPSYYVGVFGNLLALSVTVLLSLCLKPRPRDLANLTIWDQSARPLD